MSFFQDSLLRIQIFQDYARLQVPGSATANVKAHSFVTSVSHEERFAGVLEGRDMWRVGKEKYFFASAKVLFWDSFADAWV